MSRLSPGGRSRPAMPSWANVRGDGPIGREAWLGLSWGRDALRAPLTLAGGLMGRLRAVVHRAMLPLFHTGQDRALGRAVAVQLIGDQDPGVVSQFEFLVPLHQGALGQTETLPTRGTS